MEAIELAQAMVIVDHARELDAVGCHPVDVVAGRFDHILPQQRVDSIVEELLLSGNNLTEGNVVASALILLHLGIEGEHAFG